MKFNTTFRKTTGSQDVIDYINRRVSFAFARMEHVVDSGSITVSDINGPKGGVDKQCRVVIKPAGLKPIVIVEKQAELKLAVDRSISRASHSLSRQLKRKQQLAQRGVDREAVAGQLAQTQASNGDSATGSAFDAAMDTAMDAATGTSLDSAPNSIEHSIQNSTRHSAMHSTTDSTAHSTTDSAMHRKVSGRSR